MLHSWVQASVSAPQGSISCLRLLRSIKLNQWTKRWRILRAGTGIQDSTFDAQYPNHLAIKPRSHHLVLNSALPKSTETFVLLPSWDLNSTPILCKSRRSTLLFHTFYLMKQKRQERSHTEWYYGRRGSSRNSILMINMRGLHFKLIFDMSF